VLWSLVLLLLFFLVGLPISRVAGDRRSIYLAPAFGLATTVTVAYLISGNLDLPGGSSFAASAALCLCIALAFTVYQSAVKQRGNSFDREEFLAIGLVVVSCLAFLLPALSYDLGKFFGAVNFDFFYNSQDSDFLSSHSVNTFTSPRDTILPLDWSANEQGRFGIGLVAAAAKRYFGANTLTFNAQLMAALIVINGLCFFAFSRIVFGFTALLAAVSGFIILFSAGFAQSYAYFLLGQISAIPVFVTSLCVMLPLIKQEDGRGVSWTNLLLTALLLNALYVFYAILAFFAVALLGTALLLAATSSNRWKSTLWSCIRLGLITIGAFFALRIGMAGEVVSSITSWIQLSLKTAGASGAAPGVFSEYILEPFPVLLFGLATYPTNSSVTFSFLHHFQPYGAAIFLLLGFLVFVAFCMSLLKLTGDKSIPPENKALLVALSAITMVCSAAFFLTGSGYSIFKIATWFVPLVLPVFLFTIVRSHRHRRHSRLLSLAPVSALIIGANTISAATYIMVFLQPDTTRVVNARNVNGFPGVSELVAALNVRVGQNPVFLDLKNGIKNAWIAKVLPDDWKTLALTHNRQPLDDLLLPGRSCSAMTTVPSNAIVVVDNLANEIIAKNSDHYAPFFSNRFYTAFQWSEVQSYTFLGRGSYPVEQSPGFAGGEPFRWVEHRVELYHFSRSMGEVDLSMLVMPGFVNAPEQRTVTLSSDQGKWKTEFSAAKPSIMFSNVPVQAGMNCFTIEATDEVSPQLRFGAMFRNQTQMDFRFLNFAIAAVRFEPR
jgi:hypothetical protein